MDEFKDQLDFSDLHVSSSTKVQPSPGQQKEKSQAVKRMHENSQKRVDSLNNNINLASTFNTNRALGLAQNGRGDHGHVTDLHSSHTCQGQIFLDENQNESRNVYDLSHTNSSRSDRNLFHFAQGRFGETYDQSSGRECSSSTHRQANRPTQRVHKSSIERQDSITLDIGLGDCAQTGNTLFVERVGTADSQANTHDLLARLDTTNGSFKHPLEEAQDETCPNKYKYLHVLQKLFPSHNLSFNDVPDTSSTNKQIREHIQSFRERPGTCGDETEHYKSSRPMSLLLSCDDCSNNMTYDVKNVSGEKPDKNNTPAKSVSNSGKERSSQSVDGLGKGRARHDVDRVAKEGSNTWGWNSVNKKEVAMFVLVGLLAFGVFHLHGRVEAVERGLGLSLARECSCMKDAETSESGATSSGLHPGPDDLLTQTLPGLGNDQQESASTNGATHSNRLTNYLNNKNSGKFRETHFSSIEQRLNISPKQKHSPLLNPLETAETGRDIPPSKSEGFNSPSKAIFKKAGNSSGLGEKTVGEEDIVGDRAPDGHVYSSTGDVRIGARLRIPRDAAETALHRSSRSTVVRDKRIKDKINKKRDKKGRNGEKNLKSNSEVYEARFSELFPYNTNFLDKECATHPDWKKGIVGCKEELVKLQDRYSILPIYNATNETASKAPDQRLMMIKKDSLGEFIVNIPGDYLVQLNITIVVVNPHHENKHFLAIYLNDRAMLACQHGGFRCPHTNHEHFTKYKICNINGLLQLNKNDTLDIRTMDRDMIVRIQQRSFFRTILLNKRM